MRFLKHLAVAVASTLAFGAIAGEEVLFSADFSKTQDLNDWKYFNSVPNKDFQFVKDGDEQILQMPVKGIYGITHTLTKSITIDNSVKKITLAVTLRQGTNPNHIIALTLSSRTACVPGTSGPFENGKDSGFYVAGCGFNSQRHHSMGYRIDGKEIVKTTPEVAPRNMSNWNEWNTWTLVFDNEKKTIEATTSIHPDKVIMSLQNVNMDGVTLNCIHLPAQNTCYKSVKVTAER